MTLTRLPSDRRDMFGSTQLIRTPAHHADRSPVPLMLETRFEIPDYVRTSTWSHSCPRSGTSLLGARASSPRQAGMRGTTSTVRGQGCPRSQEDCDLGNPTGPGCALYVIRLRSDLSVNLRAAQGVQQEQRSRPDRRAPVVAVTKQRAGFGPRTAASLRSGPQLDGRIARTSSSGGKWFAPSS